MTGVVFQSVKQLLAAKTKWELRVKRNTESMQMYNQKPDLHSQISDDGGNDIFSLLQNIP